MSGTACSNNAYAMPDLRPNAYHHEESKRDKYSCFQMPLHYPRFKKSDYEAMAEWKLDCLLKDSGPFPAPAPAPTSDGTSIDQGVAYVLMLVALVLTYLIHAADFRF
ncbi:hypothetical protein GH714_010903 [Hevea brasiliensis]|uniref:DUF7722 domain-containing protein n=1 Tax=Hevea brasiliensis TaxID=3981 RepID=A0A6A6MI13_HEVBR|nr:hypothetical protein GH714_010903 [Hevea brasiliensis]